MTKKKVHITKLDGKWIYNRLWDDGGLILRFDSGWGFVTREDIKREHWTIREGWLGCEKSTVIPNPEE